MKDLVQIFLEPGYLVLEALSGMLSTVKICQLLDRRRGFVGFEKDTGCVKMFMAGLVEVYAFQVVDNKSDYKCGEGLMETA